MQAKACQRGRVSLWYLLGVYRPSITKMTTDNKSRKHSGCCGGWVVAGLIRAAQEEQELRPDGNHLEWMTRKENHQKHKECRILDLPVTNTWD